ncbi:hypothetical protein [Nonomuraea basaltis]|uniref:hypothetical protein n=1 Tax=Nonomuraea basaltis TaxID=2495887 RepID=UPI001F108E14|nr:hypothetical protein [Nonomuraea basaltis]
MVYGTAMVSQTPQMIAASRVVYAASVLAGTADLRGYPHRHLAVLSQFAVGSAFTLTEVLTAVEIMQHWGWELVNVASLPNGEVTSQLCAIVRRRG